MSMVLKLGTKVHGMDEAVKFPNGGVLSLGGFGHGCVATKNETIRVTREGFMDRDPFNGLMDDVMIWARSISSSEVLELYHSYSIPILAKSPSISSFNYTFKSTSSMFDGTAKNNVCTWTHHLFLPIIQNCIHHEVCSSLEAHL